MAAHTHLPKLRVQRLEVAAWHKAEGSGVGGGGLQVDLFAAASNRQSRQAKPTVAAHTAILTP